MLKHVLYDTQLSVRASFMLYSFVFVVTFLHDVD